KNFDEAEILKSYRKFHLLAYNSFVFFRTYGKKPSAKPAVSKNILDRWILSRLSEVSANTTAYLDKYEIREAALCLEGFVDDLSRWYIRRSRRRLQKPENAKDFQAASDTLYACLIALCKFAAPFMPFMSEALYLDLTSFAGKKEESIHLADWPEIHGKPDQKLSEQMKEVRRLASLGLSARAEAGIKVRQPLGTIWISEAAYKIIGDKDILAILSEEVNVKKVDAKKDLKDGVMLDKNITPELKEEGQTREIIRAVAELRQGAELKPKDKITLFLSLSKELESVIAKNENFVKKETGAVKLEYRKSDKFDAEITTKIDGAEVWLGLKKV
ncbi:MAG: class I tRNA ligase family protein, partial [Candidatus Liptonbacteria bacterium]|nr:class I tRNA ligase family protein [Candidatus Liptonbacteria bacterium]